VNVKSFFGGAGKKNGSSTKNTEAAGNAGKISGRSRKRLKVLFEFQRILGKRGVAAWAKRF
jgi:ribosomal protein L15